MLALGSFGQATHLPALAVLALGAAIISGVASLNTLDSEDRGLSWTPETSNRQQPERVTIIAPRYLRPQSDYNVLISLTNNSAPATVELQLVGARDSNREQTEAKSVVASSDETQLVKFSIGDWPAAEYVLLANVQAADRSWNFTDERPLLYQAKSYSGFIQTDKAIYKPGQQVQFRLLTLTPDLRPLVLKEALNVSVLDPQGNLIKQWLALSNYRGLLSLEMPLSEDPMLGEYTIKATARGQEFTKQFSVAEYVLPTFDVSIQLPPYATYNESDVVASVKAVYTYGKPVRGHVTLTVQPLARFQYISTRPLHQAQFNARLDSDGSTDFQLNLVKDLKLNSDDLFERAIEFFALVEEDLTGRKYNRSQTLRIHSRSVKIERLQAQKTFKPGLKSYLEYKVSKQDDTPVDNHGPDVELTYSFQESQIGPTLRLQPHNGIIGHELDVPAMVDSSQEYQPLLVPWQINIDVSYRGQKYHLSPITAQSTESQQYIQIELPQLLNRRPRQRIPRASAAPKSVKIGDELKVEVHSTEPLDRVTCQGIARGAPVWALSRRVERLTQVDFGVKLERQMAPEMRIICFHVRPQNKELVADSILVPIDGLTENSVRLTTSQDEAKPGEQVEISVLTRPNALVGVLALDQSVSLLKPAESLNEARIMEEVKGYGVDLSADRSSASQDNTRALFDDADVVVMSNNLIHDGYSSWLVRPVNSPNVLQHAAMDLSRGPGSDIKLSPYILDSPLDPPDFHLPGGNAADVLRIRTLFPETWIWQNMSADGGGRARIEARAPDTITSWELSAFSLSESHGLALSSGRTSLRVFRPFFIKLNLPYSIMRGETVSIQAVVFNYSKRPLAARVTFDNRAKQFEFVQAANSVEEERAALAESESHRVQIGPGAGASVSFLVRPLKLGHVDVRIVARSDGALGDGISKKLLVKAEGQTQHLNKAMLVRLGEGQSSWRRNISVNVPANAVEGSQKVSVSAVGDLLGQGLNHMDDLLRLPYGCGEQNMINLVPNIAILGYLQNTGRARDHQRSLAMRNIETGYQRQLNYKRLDGSFSAFGQSDANGSVWLTAYVLRTLHQAQPFTTVDPRVLEEATNFITGNIGPDGQVAEVGMLHNKELASAASERSVYLTAYSMIALLQRPATGLIGRRDEVIERGLNRLEEHLKKLAAGKGSAGYELAIIAYALHLADSIQRRASADEAYEKLWERARERGETTWWSGESVKVAEASRPSHSELDDSATPTSVSSPMMANSLDEAAREFEIADKPRETSARTTGRPAAKLTDSLQPPLKPVGVQGDQSAHLFVANSLDIEATAWALLTTVHRRELERALPIVRWLVSQQNSRGGFASTQDTVLAIEALAAFAEASLNSKAPLSVDVELVYPRARSNTTAPLRRTQLDQLLITQQNALVQQQVRLPQNITWVQVQASGSGTVVIQVSWQYNLLVAAERPAFYLNPVLDSSSTLNYLQLSVCTFYKGPGEASNMAVVEVELPSGYKADMEALRSILRQKQIKRVEADNGETRVNVYLERVTSADELCFTVPAHRSSKVSNNKPVPVTIYDYYDRKLAARIFYEPLTATSCEICENSVSCTDRCSAADAKPKSSRSSQIGTLVPLSQQRKERERQLHALEELNRQRSMQSDRNEKLTQPTQSSNQTERITGQSLISRAFAYLPISSAFDTFMKYD